MAFPVKKYITARRVSLGLILLLAVLMYLSTLIPQSMDSTPEKIDSWRRDHHALVRLVDGANLHRIYSQRWFAAIILLAATALTVSSYDQIVAARRKLYATTTGADALVAAIPEATLRSVARSNGYHCLNTGSSAHLKFVRNPWGYFGNALLHSGMVLVVGASLYVAVTGRQGMLTLLEGEQRDASQSWDNNEYGSMTSPLRLSGSIRLDRLRAVFDDKNQPVQVSSDITVANGAGATESLTATINGITRYHGLRVYHTTQYGDAFTLEFIDITGETHVEKLPLQQPPSLTKASYGNFALTWSPYLLSAKYFADADKRSMTSTTPSLVMRLLNGEQEISRVALVPGGYGLLGGYRVHLLGVQKWSTLIFVDISGMPVIFAGFAIIMLGGLLHYMTPPRELIGVTGGDGSYQVYWRAVSFKEFYRDERDEIAQDLKRERTL